MNRRGFLSFLGLSPAMYAVDKRSLWDSVKGLFRPKVRHFQVSMNWRERRVLSILESQHMSFERFAAEFAEQLERDYKIGDTIRIKYPSRFIVECDKCNIF